MRTLLILLLVPFAALADAPYARQWPLHLDTAAAGAYRVVLDASVYRQLQSPSLADLDVLDAHGQPVPAALLDASAPDEPRAKTVPLPWFPLPPGERARDVALISEISPDGSVRRVEWRYAGNGADAGNGFLLDASRVQAPVRALVVQWATPADAPFDVAVRVSASDDLRQWRTVADGAHLVELTNAGQRIVRDRIETSPVKARYLRVVPLDATAPPLQVSAVTAELEPPAQARTWQWRTLQGHRADDADGTVHYEFELDGRFPVARADVSLPGNSSGEWRLQARDDAQAPWHDVAPAWMAFRLNAGGREDASPPQSLHGIRRDRLWRLTPRQGASHPSAPGLRLGYRPEALVFVAQGEEPFALVAGSARARRADAPLASMIDAIRTQRGAQWEPATAALGPSIELAGAAALTPPPAERDWKAWLLWGVLLAGAALVAGFAVSLLRKPTG